MEEAHDKLRVQQLQLRAGDRLQAWSTGLVKNQEIFQGAESQVTPKIYRAVYNQGGSP